MNYGMRWIGCWVGMVLAGGAVWGAERRISSGFEADTVLPVSGGKRDFFQGKDNRTGLDWDALPSVPGLLPGPNYAITYWGGTAHLHSTADLRLDTDSAHGRVLMFQVTSDDGVSPNARTSMDVDLDPNTFNDVGLRYQMKIDPSFQNLPADPADIPNVEGSTGPARLWWVMMEVWFHNTDGVRASIPVDIERNKVDEYKFKKVQLRLLDQAPPNDIVTLWAETPGAAAPTIPIGQWVTIELYIKRGLAGTGRFFLALNHQVVFDVTNRDIAYGDFTWYQWNPLKLYIDLSTMAWMTSNGTPARVYYDHFEVWAGPPGRFTSPPTALRTK